MVDAAQTTLDGAIVKSVRAGKQNLVFGWANVPHPMAKAAAGSLEGDVDEVRAAFDAQFPVPTDGSYLWVVATFPDYVVVERQDTSPSTTYWRYSYARTDQDTLVFGAPVQVEQTYVEKALADPAALVHKARVPKEDLQGDRVWMEDLEKGAYAFVLDSRQTDVEHDATPVGALVESMVFTQEKYEALGIPPKVAKTLPEGWWLGFKTDDQTFERVESGELTMFSIGGTAFRTAE